MSSYKSERINVILFLVILIGLVFIPTKCNSQLFIAGTYTPFMNTFGIQVNTAWDNKIVILWGIETGNATITDINTEISKFNIGIGKLFTDEKGVYIASVAICHNSIEKYDLFSATVKNRLQEFTYEFSILRNITDKSYMSLTLDPIVFSAKIGFGIILTKK